jgi:hypothetical protein
MNKKFVQVLCDVDCRWEGLAPTYRLYVNNELFVERTWIWQNEYLEELIQIEAVPGVYEIKYELVPPHLAQLSVGNARMQYGPGEIQGTTLRILDENS